MIIGLVLSAAVACTARTDSGTLENKKRLKERIERVVSQYESCNSADDCTFFPEVDGFIVNKDGLPLVMECSRRLKVALFPKCFPRNSLMEPAFGMEAEPPNVPHSISCQNNRCIAVYKGEKWTNWNKENRLYLKKVRNKMFKIDSLCEDILKKDAENPSP